MFQQLILIQEDDVQAIMVQGLHHPSSGTQEAQAGYEEKGIGGGGHGTCSPKHWAQPMDFKEHLGNPTQTQGLNVEWSSAEPGIELL